MSWLHAQVGSLEDPGPPEQFLRRVEAVVETLAAKPGVTAVFAAHEGLLVATAGTADFEALAASAQLAMALPLPADGPLQQVVLVGRHEKLAILRAGPVLLGLWAPLSTHLAEVTRRG